MRDFLEGTPLTLHGMERDTQRARLYRAEDRIGKGPVFSDVEEIREFAAKVYGHTWIKGLLPYEVKCPDITVRGDGKSFYFYDGRIQISRPHMNTKIVLHEIAHSLNPKPHAPHGRWFCYVYLNLVRIFLSEEMSHDLQEAMNSHGVKWGPKTT